jgi:hypothetical protein
MLNEDIMKKIAQAIVEESAQLDGVQPEEMLREVAGYLNNEQPRPYCGIAEVVHHKGVKVTEDIVRKIAIAVIKEAEQLEGVNPEEMVQKVVGALQGESVTEVPALTNESAIMKQRGVQIDMEIAKRVTEAVLKEAAELDGVVPAEMIQKVLSAIRPMEAAEGFAPVAASAAVSTPAAASASRRPASMVGTERINPEKTDYSRAPLAQKGTDPKEVVIGVGPGFQKEIRATICGIPLDDVLREIKAGIEEEGLIPRVVKVLKTSDVCFMGLEAAKISGSGIGIGLQSKGTAVIHQKDLYPLSNLELFPQAPLMNLETYRKIGQNAAKYAKGEQVTPISSVNDPMCRAKYQVKAAIMHIAETEQVDPNYPIIAWPMQ